MSLTETSPLHLVVTVLMIAISLLPKRDTKLFLVVPTTEPLSQGYVATAFMAAPLFEVHAKPFLVMPTAETGLLNSFVTTSMTAEFFLLCTRAILFPEMPCTETILPTLADATFITAFLYTRRILSALFLVMPPA